MARDERELREARWPFPSGLPDQAMSFVNADTTSPADPECRVAADEPARAVAVRGEVAVVAELIAHDDEGGVERRADLVDGTERVVERQFGDDALEFLGITQRMIRTRREDVQDHDVPAFSRPAG